MRFSFADYCFQFHSRKCPGHFKAESILERKRFLSLCRMRISVFWGQERLTDRSISKRYLKSDIATRVQLQERYTLVTQDSIGHLKTLCMSVLSLVVAMESEWQRDSSSQSDKKNASVLVWIQLKTIIWYCNTDNFESVMGVWWLYFVCFLFLQQTQVHVNKNFIKTKNKNKTNKNKNKNKKKNQSFGMGPYFFNIQKLKNMLTYYPAQYNGLVRVGSHNQSKVSPWVD